MFNPTLDKNETGCAWREPFALQVLGDSMEPEFPDQCIVVIEQAEECRHGMYVFVEVAGVRWFRQYRVDEQGSECRRARDAKRDIPVPLSPCARATTCTCRGRPAPGPRLRHFAPPPDPYDEWLDGVSDALASGLRQLRDLRPLRHFGQPLAPTPTADYPPRASRFPGGQRGNGWSP